MRNRLALASAVLVVSAGLVRADVSLPSVFSDHMVLQRGVSSVPVWGKADAGEAVIVSVAGATASTTAGADGKWKVEFKDLKGTGGPTEMVVKGKNEITISDVLVGEVWLCSGQSNMDFRIARTDARRWCGVVDQEKEIAAADYPEIRMFLAEAAMSGEPQADVTGKWWVCKPENAGEFSAVAYYFGRELHQQLKAPVGLVVSSYGASKAQAWTSPKSMEAAPELAGFVSAYRAAVKAYPEMLAKSEAALKEWEVASAKAKEAGTTIPRKPGTSRHPQKNAHNAGVLYNGMLVPLAPYAVKGVIWYQGESNGNDVDAYLPLMKTLIADWRQLWGNPELPFLSVQLANYKAPATQPVQENSQIAQVREVQLKTGTLPHTAWVTAVDIGDAKNVHPKNKVDVGKRLALAARSVAYGENVAWSGPTVAAVTPEASSLRIKFDHTDGGLVVKGEKLAGFALKNTEGKWVEADAKIDGNSVLLSALGVDAPKEARYAWADNPPITLYNGAGLPASPFRTDGD